MTNPTNATATAAAAAAVPAIDIFASQFDFASADNDPGVDAPKGSEVAYVGIGSDADDYAFVVIDRDDNGVWSASWNLTIDGRDYFSPTPIRFHDSRLSSFRIRANAIAAGIESLHNFISEFKSTPTFDDILAAFDESRQDCEDARDAADEAIANASAIEDDETKSEAEYRAADRAADAALAHYHNAVCVAAERKAALVAASNNA